MSAWYDRPVLGRWSALDIVQGRPLGHPSHPLFIHFPAGLLPAAFFLDLASQVWPDRGLGRVASFNVGLGLAGAVPSALTGLVDYLGMVGGSKKKRVATRHLIAQLTAVGAFGLSLRWRLGRSDRSRTPRPALALAGVGLLALLVGNYLGGQLVYRHGMRVSTGS